MATTGKTSYKKVTLKDRLLQSQTATNTYYDEYKQAAVKAEIDAVYQVQKQGVDMQNITGVPYNGWVAGSNILNSTMYKTGTSAVISNAVIKIWAEDNKATIEQQISATELLDRITGLLYTIKALKNGV